MDNLCTCKCWWSNSTTPQLVPIRTSPPEVEVEVEAEVADEDSEYEDVEEEEDEYEEILVES